MIRVGEFDARDRSAFDEWFAVLNLTDAEIWPDKPGWQASERLAMLQDTDSAEEHRGLLARGADGGVVGIADVEMYRRENRHLARMDVRVRPEHRRQGVGRAIVHAATALVAGLGRTELGGMDQSPVRDGYLDAAGPFARRLGFSSAQTMVRRELRLPPDPARMQALTEQVSQSASEYAMISFGSTWPEEFLDDRCELGRRMSTDIPMGEQDLDEEVWDAARVRDMEALLAAQNRAKVTTAAQCVATGRLVAYTEIAVPLGAVESVWQHDTLVTREHRGHGLGLALKVANTAALVAAYPDARIVNTFNASENEHMIAINDAMGYRVTATSTYWLKRIGPS